MTEESEQSSARYGATPDQAFLQCMVAAAFDRSPIHGFIIDRQYRFLYLSPLAAEVMGVSSEMAIGKTGTDIGLPPSLVELSESEAQKVFDSGAPVRGEGEYDLGGPRVYIEHNMVPMFAGNKEVEAVMMLIIDRTEQVRYRKVLEALASVNTMLTSLGSGDSIAAIVCAVAGSLGEDGFALAIRKDGKWVAHQSLPLRPEETAELGAEAVRLAGMVVRSGEEMNIEDAARDERVNGPIASKYAIHPLLLVPVAIDGVTSGAIIFSRSRPEPFSPAEVIHAHQLATSISLALTNRALLDELRIAGEENAAMLMRTVNDRNRVRKLIECTPVVMALFAGEEPRLVTCNAAFRDALEAWPNEGPEGLPYHDLLDEEERSRLAPLLDEVKRTGQPVEKRDHVRHLHGGRERHFRLSLVPLSAQPFEFLMVATDQTDMVEAQAKVLELVQHAEGGRKRLRAILDQLPVGVVVLEADGSVFAANKLREDIWGGRIPATAYPIGAGIFQGRWSDTGLPLRKEDWPVVMALRGEGTRGALIDIQRFDGRHATVLISAAPILDPSNRVTGAVGIVQDVTEQRRLEQDAVGAKERAELYLELLTRDVNSINADIADQIRQAGERGDHRKEHFAIALSSVEESTKLIDVVQKLQRIESANEVNALVDLGLIIEEAVDEQLKRPDNRARIEHRPQLRRFVLATDLLRDVFANIIGNAVKHADRPVDINIALFRAFAAGREYHKVVIEDDGPGIDDQVKSKVFVGQFRGSNAPKGTGLGLYLVKKAVEDYGGRVWVEDRVPGDHTKGARFVVMLPAASAPRDGP